MKTAKQKLIALIERTVPDAATKIEASIAYNAKQKLDALLPRAIGGCADLASVEVVDETLVALCSDGMRQLGTPRLRVQITTHPIQGDAA